MTSARPLPPTGLCATCRHGEALASARSTFLRCRRADADARYPKYPPLPVRACEGYEGGDEEAPRRLRNDSTIGSS